MLQGPTCWHPLLLVLRIAFSPVLLEGRCSQAELQLRMHECHRALGLRKGLPDCGGELAQRGERKIPKVTFLGWGVMSGLGPERLTL